MRGEKNCERRRVSGEKREKKTKREEMKGDKSDVRKNRKKREESGRFECAG